MVGLLLVAWGEEVAVHNRRYGSTPTAEEEAADAAAVVVGDIVSTGSLASSSTWIERIPNVEPRDLQAAQRLRRQEQEKTRRH